MNKKTWKKLLGYDPGREQKEMILATVRDEGITLAEACGRMAMPPIYIDGKDVPDSDKYDNPYRPAILIRTRKSNNE
jgi:hypothetical protein